MLYVIYGLLGIAVLIAVMGIGNTLALSIHERTRELGLLRAVGQSAAQLRSSLRWESVIVAVFGTVGGLGLGTFLGWGLMRAMNAQEGFGVVRRPGRAARRDPRPGRRRRRRRRPAAGPAGRPDGRPRRDRDGLTQTERRVPNVNDDDVQPPAPVAPPAAGCCGRSGYVLTALPGRRHRVRHDHRPAGDVGRPADHVRARRCPSPGSCSCGAGRWATSSAPGSTR